MDLYFSSEFTLKMIGGGEKMQFIIRIKKKIFFTKKHLKNLI